MSDHEHDKSAGRRVGTIISDKRLKGTQSQLPNAGRKAVQRKKEEKKEESQSV